MTCIFTISRENWCKMKLRSTFELTGAEIVDALENGVSLADNPTVSGAGRFPQVSGIRYS